MIINKDLKLLAERIGDSVNYDTVILRIKNAQKNIKRVGKSPRLYSVVKKLLYETDFSLNEENITNALIAAQDKFYFENKEIFSLCDHIALALLEASRDSDDETLERQINCIRTIDILNVAEIYRRVSIIERFLTNCRGCVYSKCDEATKARIRAKIDKYASSHCISTLKAASILADKNTYNTYSRAKKVAYFFSIFLITLALTILSFILLGNDLLFVSFLLIMPQYEFARQLSDMIFSYLRIDTTLPKLKLDCIPDHAKTVIVITSLLLGEKKDAHLFDLLEKYYLTNRDKNAVFGILGDLPDSHSIINSCDEATMTYAQDRINSLNAKYGGGFTLFIRHRSWSRTESKFIARERKRGAVIELVRLIKRKPTGFSRAICDRHFMHEVKYLITLDADSQLYIGSVREMLGAMLHPSNRITIENGIVTAGHAVMQPRMEVSLEGSAQTPFTAMLSGSGGIDIYSSGAFDVYQGLFDEGIFCGKGIIDVDAFYHVIDGAFPDEKILSHDLLEGTRLRAGLLSDITLTDNLPSTPASYLKRSNRWIRGDIQALSFAGKNCVTGNGRRVKNPISALSIYKITDNVRRAFVPIFSLLSMFFALAVLDIRVEYVFFISISYMVLPVISSVFTASRNISRRFYSFVVSEIWHTFCNFLFSLSSLPSSALNTLDAFFRTVFRMTVSKRHLLQWTTAAESEKLKHIDFIIAELFTFISGIVVFLFVPHFVFTLLSLTWIAYPFACYLLSRRPVFFDPTVPKPEQKRILSEYARDIWGFFEDYITSDDNYLPPDNIQLNADGNYTIAHRTSPTNIGLYLLSVLCARDFGIISTSEVASRLKNTLNTISRLKKYRGQLYNWYDTQSLDTLGDKLISTVDNGNYICSLVALREGLKEYVSQDSALLDIISELSVIIDETDFSFLYNKARRLFYIGYDTDKSEPTPNCYDIFMTECRLASYYCVARGIVGREHWAALARLLISADGFMGMLSWNGTAFEYFMPPLFLSPRRNSLEYESLNFALMIETKNKFGGVWGKSECCYYAFNPDMSYKYKAIGIQKLGIERGLVRDCTVSPYSSFLTLSVSVPASLRNLRNLQESGVYGKYGFYEAVDFTEERTGGSRRNVECFMSHHLGMSFVAAANSCFSSASKRFFADPQMAAAHELTSEKIPTNPRFVKAKIITSDPVKKNSRDGLNYRE